MKYSILCIFASWSRFMARPMAHLHVPRYIPKVHSTPCMTRTSFNAIVICILFHWGCPWFCVLFMNKSILDKLSAVTVVLGCEFLLACEYSCMYTYACQHLIITVDYSIPRFFIFEWIDSSDHYLTMQLLHNRVITLIMPRNHLSASPTTSNSLTRARDKPKLPNPSH